MPKQALEARIRELVSRISAEVERLQQGAEQAAEPSPHLAIPRLSQADQLRRFEEVISRALKKAAPQTWFGRLLAKLSPRQKDFNLLVIELVTNLFETYRALTYECLRLEQVEAEFKRDVVLFQKENEIRRQEIEALLREFADDHQPQRDLLRGS